MSLERRDGQHPGTFSREIRSIAGGGTIPDEWGCRVVDLDEFYAVIEGELFRVNCNSRLWVWYRLPVEIVAIAEQKHYLDLQQAWDVTRAFATSLGIDGFRVVAQPDGTRRVTDVTNRTETFATTRDFVERRVWPLIADWPF